ncbi:MAG: 3-hydroxyisobutyrate dehydrogenase, partial [Rhodospirillaceae bacterium]|nr:3-hydroxyisobutyrate dehydrogenase [Rhodospirillaceae bacterium]
LDSDKLDAVVGAGAEAADSIAAAADGVDTVVTMLPAGRHVRGVYTDEGGVLASAPAGALLIDCSTIDVATAREVAGTADAAGFAMLDAPVSGGVVGAEAATLTFMVGGADDAFAKARPLLDAMGKNIFHAGPSGAGQAAKMCNNMILGVSMIGVSEAFALARKVGLDPKKLFEVSSTASGQCWALTTYCPEPGILEGAPSSKGYKPGFTAAMMLKDLKLAQDAAGGSGAETPLGRHAMELYERFVEAGGAETDFSGIIRMLKGEDG